MEPGLGDLTESSELWLIGQVETERRRVPSALETHGLRHKEA